MMRHKSKIRFFLLAIALGLHATCIFADYIYQDDRSPKAYGSVKAYLEYVYDGDTIKVNIPNYPSILGKGILVRVARLDAPEMTSKHPLVRPLARRIQQYVEMRAKNAKTIWLTNMRRDKYFRILAEVWFDGHNLSDRLLELGFVLPYDGGTKKSWDELMTDSWARSLNVKIDQAMRIDANMPKINTTSLYASFSSDSDYA